MITNILFRRSRGLLPRFIIPNRCVSAVWHFRCAFIDKLTIIELFNNDKYNVKSDNFQRQGYM